MNGLPLYTVGAALLGLFLAKRKGKVQSAVKWGAIGAVVAIAAPRFGVNLPGLAPSARA